MKADRSALDYYAADAAKYPLLTVEQEKQIAFDAFAGSQSARHKLVVHNLRFVMQYAHKLSGYRVPIEDLIQEGNIGLLIAAAKFDPRKGFRFCSYATWWIKARMMLYITRNFFIMKRMGTQRERKRLFSDLAGLAREKEISLETRLDDTRTIFSVLESDYPAPDTLLDERTLVEGVRKALSGAARTDRQMDILCRRTLVDGGAKLQELGDELGLSRERIRQNEAEMVRRARRELRAIAKASGLLPTRI